MAISPGVRDTIVAMRFFPRPAGSLVIASILLASALLVGPRVNAAINVSLPTVTAAPGATVDLPITTTPAPAGLGIQSVDYQIGFAANIVQSVQVLGDGWLPTLGVPFVTTTTTQLTLSDAGFAATTSTLTTLHTLRFVLKANAPLNTDMPVTFARFFFDEGTPAVVVTNGVIKVRGGLDAPPVAQAGLALAAPSPNPAVHATRLSYSLPVAAKVSLAVFAIDGRRVRSLQSGAMLAGSHEVVWDLQDDHGRALPAGLYLARLQAGDTHREQRLAVIH